MRVLLLPAVALALVGAKDAPESGVEASPKPEASSSAKLELQTRIERSRSNTGQLRANECADRIHDAKSSRDSAQVVVEPPIGLERRPAQPGEGYAIWAVDRRENVCPVMVMMGDLNDIHPVPSSSPNDVRRILTDD